MMKNKFAAAVYAIIVLVFLFSLVAIWSCIQSSAGYLNKTFVCGPLEISLLLLLGSTIFGTAIIMWAKSIETFPFRFVTGLVALKGSWCCQAYWHWPVQCCSVFTAICLLWLSCNLWAYRKSKDSKFWKWPIIAFSMILIGMISFGLLEMIREPEPLVTLLSHPESYTDAVFSTVCVVFISLNVLLLELVERRKSKQEAL